MSIVPKLTEGGFSTETRPFRRIQAVTLLSTLYHNPNIRDQIDENLTSDLAKKLMTSLDTFVKGDINLKHKMLCELLHLIFGLHLSGAKCVPWDDMKAIDMLDEFCNVMTLRVVEGKLPYRLQIIWAELKSEVSSKGSKEKMICLKDFIFKQSKIAEEVLSMRGTSSKDEHANQSYAASTCQ